MRALLLCLELQGCCRKHESSQGLGLRVREGVDANTPASQTLIVLSHEPDTMVLPSGEKATEVTMLLCALCFSALSSRDAATSTEAVRFGLRVGGCQC